MNNRRAWGIYFWLMLLLVSVGTLGEIFGSSNLDLGDLFGYILTALSLVALYGFVDQKPIGIEILWRILFVIEMLAFLPILIVSVVLDVKTLAGRELLLSFMGFFSALTVIGPLYYATYQYAFENSNLWSRATNQTRHSDA